MGTLHLPSEQTFTHQQAEVFIAQQARLLQNEEPGALSPSRLQYEITALKETNPDLPETVSSYIMFLSVIFQFCDSFKF